MPISHGHFNAKEWAKEEDLRNVMYEVIQNKDAKALEDIIRHKNLTSFLNIRFKADSSVHGVPNKGTYGRVLGPSLLEVAAKHKAKNCAEVLLRHGAYLNDTNNILRGKTAMHWAAYNGDKPMLELLARYDNEIGTALYAQDLKGLTPLEVAIEAAESPRDTKSKDEYLSCIEFLSGKMKEKQPRRAEYYTLEKIQEEDARLFYEEALSAKL